jgi:aspartyl-tRNA(Asn)/glutamyl-tRNA(Gln) amidotransferase subunit B
VSVAYEAVIGLEIHAQLLTRSKIFCGCSTTFGAPPNTHVCPVCLGLPGALPVLNRAAVNLAVRASLALGCEIRPRSIFARKNYFYPDLPKGYQISQYEQPLAEHGLIAAGSDHWTPANDIRIKRVHLEEDAGKLLHEGIPGSSDRSHVDLNRAGVPLIEIVTEPDLRVPKDAAGLFSALRELLVALEVNDGNMEEGSLRCDANVSVRPAGATALGTKVEVKNLNSFRFVEKALEYEIDRQCEIVAEGGRIVQETRLFDAAGGRTYAMRSKEEAHDYRYFPEPDLPPLVVDAARVVEIRNAMPELPGARRRRMQTRYGLSEADVVTLTQVAPGMDGYFEAVVSAGADARAAKNWLLGAVRAKMNDAGLVSVAVVHSRVPPARLASLIGLVESGRISGAMGKDVFEKMFETSRSPEEIVAAEGLAQIDDEAALAGLVADVLASHPDAVAQIRAGKAATIGFLVGQVMKAAGGKANPKQVNALIRSALEGT